MLSPYRLRFVIWGEVEREPSQPFPNGWCSPSPHTTKSFFWIFLNLPWAAGRNCGGKTCKRYVLFPCICHSQGFHTFTFAYTCLLLDSLKCSSCTFLPVLLCFPASASGKQMLESSFFFSSDHVSGYLFALWFLFFGGFKRTC